MDKVNLPVEKQSYASAVRGAAMMASMFERREAAGGGGALWQPAKEHRRALSDLQIRKRRGRESPVPSQGN